MQLESIFRRQKIGFFFVVEKKSQKSISYCLFVSINIAMDEQACVCNHSDRLIHLVCVQHFPPNHHNNFSSNVHLTYDKYLTVLLMMPIDVCQALANHDNLVESYFLRAAMDINHVRKPNRLYRELNEDSNVYQNP